MKVWIDCDPGIDDTLALLYALKHPSLDVVGISTVSGNVRAVDGATNVSKLFTFLKNDYVDIPTRIYAGYESDCRLAKDTHGENGIGNYYMPIGYPNNGIQIYHSPQIMLDAMHKSIHEFPNQLVMVCLGPLTNLCELLYKYPDDIDFIKTIYIMGGCYKYPGNCSPVVEFNFWHDSTAASRVFDIMQYCNKLNVIPLEITHQIRLSKNMLPSIKHANIKIGQLVEGITEFYFDFHKKQEGLIDECVINDPVVLVALTNPDLLKFEPYFVSVIQSENECVDGQMIVDVKDFYKKMPNCNIAIDINVAMFWKYFINIITE